MFGRRLRHGDRNAGSNPATDAPLALHDRFARPSPYKTLHAPARSGSAALDRDRQQEPNPRNRPASGGPVRARPPHPTAGQNAPGDRFRTDDLGLGKDRAAAKTSQNQDLSRAATGCVYLVDTFCGRYRRVVSLRSAARSGAILGGNVQAVPARSRAIAAPRSNLRGLQSC